ncbi:hypothetical protein CGH71_22555 [Vibrio parahaemolyticus]|nr:hypothetical protein CGH71_22555 [Vibrio parahaemolyticus]
MAKENQEDKNEELSCPSPNAALSGEQRRPLHLKYCTVNTKFKVNQKCRALGIRLKCFVSNMT